MWNFFEGLGRLIGDHWWEVMLAGFVLRAFFSRSRRDDEDQDD
jgi:hypothetical protein